MKLRQLVVIFWLASLIVSSGCSEPAGPATYPVTGKLTMQGQAVAALVVFTPIDNDDQTVLASQSETDAEGLFQLRTYLGNDDYKDGVQTGEYAVTATKLEVVQDMRRKPKDLLPRKYGLPKTSPLKATVKASDDNHFEFSLD